MPAQRRMRLLSLALVLLSSAGSLLALEAALRIRRGAGLLADPDPTAALRMLRGNYPARYDPRLGHAPTPGAALRDPKWGTVTIDARGLRENGGPPPPPCRTILAVGDSYTFGDQVNDRETWPAALERRLGIRVVNGGVFGYGFDQIVLRAEALGDELSPDVLVVSLIPDDVQRTEFSYRFAHKPYVVRVDAGLALRNTPVPDPDTPPPGENAWRRALRRSFLVEFLLRRLEPTGWLVRGGVRVHHDGAAIARDLVERLATQAASRGQRLLLVAAWHPGARRELLDPVRESARELRIELLELEPVLRGQIDARAGDWSHLFFVAEGVRGHQPAHMTPYGNGVVADAIAEQLRASLPASPASG